MHKTWIVTVTAAGLAVAALSLTPAARAGETAWVQHAADGPSVRVATDAAACPEVVFDGVAVATTERAAPGDRFPRRTCTVAVPAGARSAALSGDPLPLPSGRLERIVVIGDTGCRVKGDYVQACDDAAAWPFARIATAAAAERPDLVIHVGDYLYRETPCPPGEAGCAGSPSGDTWTTWRSDFFEPAAALLGAAPWIVVRGNHEICERAGMGWTRFLGPQPSAGPCRTHDAAYTVTVGDLAFAVLDAAAAPDNALDPAVVADLAPEFAALAAAAAKAPTWLLVHKPMYSVVRVENGRGLGVSRTLAAAAGGAIPSDVRLALSGHVHKFEALDFSGGAVPQLVVGNSGTALDAAVPGDLAGIVVGDRVVTRGLEVHEFGYLVLERAGEDWDATLKDPDGHPLATCTIDPGMLACRATK